MSRRSRILRDLDVELGRQFRRQFIGETAEVLIENDDVSGIAPDAMMAGRSERYFKVYIRSVGRRLRNNEIVSARLIENRQQGMVGVPLS